MKFHAPTKLAGAGAFGFGSLLDQFLSADFKLSPKIQGIIESDLVGEMENSPFPNPILLPAQPLVPPMVFRHFE